MSEKNIMFVGSTCPNCKAAKMWLDKNGIEYETIDVMDNVDMTNLHEIRMIPTMIVYKNDGSIMTIAGFGRIKRYFETAQSAQSAHPISEMECETCEVNG